VEEVRGKRGPAVKKGGKVRLAKGHRGLGGGREMGGELVVSLDTSPHSKPNYAKKVVTTTGIRLLPTTGCRGNRMERGYRQPWITALAYEQSKRDEKGALPHLRGGFGGGESGTRQTC